MPQKKKANSKEKKGAKTPVSIPLMGKQTSIKRSAAPVAVTVSTSNPSYLTLGKAASHRDFGANSLRLTGRQYLCPLTTAAASPDIFGSGLASVAANVFGLSPDLLNGRAALIARNYSRYAFRRAVVHYVPDCSTATAGSFALGYVNDGYATNVATATYTTVQTCQPAILTAYRNEGKLDVTYTGDLTWFTEQETGSAAGYRSSEQGLFVAYGSGNYGSVTNLGQFYMEFTLDLYGPSMDYGFTVTLRDQKERDFVQAQLRNFRDKSDVLSVRSFGSNAR